MKNKIFAAAVIALLAFGQVGKAENGWDIQTSTNGSVTTAEKLIRAIQQTSGRESRYVKLYNEITKLSDEKQVRYYADRIEGISYEAYAGFLKRAKEEGDIRSDLDERMFAFFFDSLLMTLQFSYTCDYYRERFKVYCGDDIFDNDEAP